MCRINLKKLRLLIALSGALVAPVAFGQEEIVKPVSEPTPLVNSATEADVLKKVESLDEPLYNPFIERYLIDEVRNLRDEQQRMRAELIKEITDRELSVADRAMSYSTNTVTYFFYILAGASSLLVLVGWSSLREVKDRVHKLADEQIRELVSTYEKRLDKMEAQIKVRGKQIKENADEIERTNEIHSLWLRTSQEVSVEKRIEIYDQILLLRPDDVEAMTHKADDVLELREPQWALNLCLQALSIEPEHAHAHYQQACSYAMMEHDDQAMQSLKTAVELSNSYYGEALHDPLLAVLVDTDSFKELADSLALS